jgi:hypothetical protein
MGGRLDRGAIQSVIPACEMHIQRRSRHSINRRTEVTVR